ncbi:hypothetical protein [Nitrospira sp. Nam80]
MRHIFDYIERWHNRRQRRRLAFQQLPQKPITQVSAETAVLKHLFNYCRGPKLYEGGNPAEEIKMVKEPKRHLRFLEADEEQRLIEASTSPLKELIIIGINCELRTKRKRYPCGSMTSIPAAASSPFKPPTRKTAHEEYPAQPAGSRRFDRIEAMGKR